ncbi:MAG: EAL domain-containing protein [Candidatus Eremiobacteraeota bacterium]|nr:EAL domain-containing protein [Candidatus Eremiobacteraeota bacterium]
MFEQLPPVLERRRGDVAGEALFVADAESGVVSFVNALAAEAFGLATDDLTDVRMADLVPELGDLGQRRFVTSADTPNGRQAFDVVVTTLAGAPGSGAALVALRRRATAFDGTPEEKRSERLESLWTLVVRRGFAGAEQVRALLREAVGGIELERATLARVDGHELVVDFADDEEHVASRIPIETSLERGAVGGSGTFAVLDTALDSEYAKFADTTRCFLSSAFRVGEERWVLTFASSTPRAEPFGREDWAYVDDVVEAVARGIERRENDERIERLAYFDALTSLPNRMALHARLDEALADAERTEARAAVLFLDIDGFKGVNDTVGHRGGDVVLAEVAQRLRSTLCRDEYIGRLGGDEFAIVMPCIADRAEIESIANRIGGVLTFPFAVEGNRFSLSASIGVAIYPDDASGRDELLACADAAMYSAKNDGGSRVRFRDAPNGGAGDASFADHSALAGEPRDMGYLLCYQPILDLRHGRVTAAEALIRRIHPVHGLLAPERGWSIASDEAGRRALDRWVLREAVMQAAAWNRGGTPIRVDVNLAAYDVGEIDALLANEQLASDVRFLRVEITARQFEDEHADGIVAFVKHCAASGIGFTLDGFDGKLGALASLAHLPIATVKLGRALVEGLAVSRTTRAIVEGSILVARSLGWSVVAKGVETGAQNDALVALGCDAVQGFYVAHPMTAKDFGAWLRDRSDLLERQA